MMDPQQRYVELINAQYGARDLAESILRKVRRARPEGAAITARDLYPFDQVHTGAAEATRELAEMAGFASGQRILDVGCGLGGTARFLAAECGCRVAGVDLTEAYCEAARRLTAEAGLGDRVEFILGDATALPFPNGDFDGALLQHCTMNIPHQGRLFRECARVLRPGGMLALHEWVKLGDDPMILPVRWADTPEINFIAPRAAFERGLADAGFVGVVVRDVSDESRRWMEARAAGAESPRAGLLFSNMARNLAEGRAACLMGVYRLPVS
ncbi:MAG TPA: methyltransferase domain-containing protein [Candidatus Methylomirabilis sp.]|jgi:SAM-dependent methyltransferase